jgi:hypothetical protein
MPQKADLSSKESTPFVGVYATSTQPTPLGVSSIEYAHVSPMHQQAQQIESHCTSLHYSSAANSSHGSSGNGSAPYQPLNLTQ